MEDIKIEFADDLEIAIREEACIYEVPTQIRNVRERAYTPQEVSIGLIRKDNRKESMEVQKMRYYKEFCGRFETEDESDDLRRQLARIICEQKQNIINCYEKDPNIPLNDFVKLILLDAVFIMELFLRRYYWKKYLNDFIFGRFWIFDAVQQDLLLLENQLPFNILDQLYVYSFSNFKFDGDLYHYSFSSHNVECDHLPSFLDLTCEFFYNCGPRGRNDRDPSDLSKVNVMHFTDLVRHFWLIDNPGIQSEHFHEDLYIPSAKDLKDQAGVEFEVYECRTVPKVFFEVKKNLLWKVGKLVMSNIVIENMTEAIIRNVMVLEHCYYRDKPYVSSYVTLLDCLINTVEDVNLLVKHKIISNKLGDNALVAKMINELCYQVNGGTDHQVFQQLDEFYKSGGIRRMATLKRVYFKDTWTATATIAAAFVIVFQIAQTYSSIWQIAHGSK